MVQFQNAPAPGHIRHTRICKNRQGAQRKIRATLITIKKSASRQKHMEYCTAHKDLQGQARRPREKEANKETRHASLSASIRLLRLQRLSTLTRQNFGRAGNTKTWVHLGLFLTGVRNALIKRRILSFRGETICASVPLVSGMLWVCRHQVGHIAGVTGRTSMLSTGLRKAPKITAVV